MVATRRGGRVDSPANGAEENRSTVQATPSTARRTRRTQQDELVKQTVTETCSQTERRRSTRASRLRSLEKPSSPEDTSDLESLCSAVSDAEQPLEQTRAKRRQVDKKDQERDVSEEESSSSAMSAAKPKLGSRQSTRRKPAQNSDPAAGEVGDSKEETEPETESGSQVVTRSQRKAAHTRSSARRRIEDSELSEAESGTSSVSGQRPRRQICPIPMHLGELSENSRSPSRTPRKTKATTEKVDSSKNDDKKPCCESDGFESGPTYSLSSCRRGRSQSAVSKSALDSESEEAEVTSSVGSRGTPCSSRSGTSSRRAQTSGVVLQKNEEPDEEQSLFNDSKLESTVIAEDADCTLVEEEEIQTSGEQENLDGAELTSTGAGDKKDEEEKMDPSVNVRLPEDGEPAVITEDLKEELSFENKAGEASEMETTQETIPPSEPVQSLQSVPETHSEMIETVESKEEEADVHHTQAGQPLEEENLKIQVGESKSEQQPKDVVVQKTKTVSLLDSSDDEDEDLVSDEDLNGEEDDSGRREQRREPSNMSDAASAVQGMFMIDTRPGQAADQQYYREEGEAADKGAEEEDEEFVDEEGDEDEDEDSKVLFTSRNSQLEVLSSRIDPGLRVKELGGLYISFDGSKSKPVSSSLQKLKERKSQDEVMKKSVIGLEFEKKDAVPPYSESKQALKLKRKEERDKSTGDGWFNMKAPEITQELKGDLRVLKMRGSLDPKRFYKKNDRDGFPKYFQVGTVVDSPVDFYHSRIPKKERKRTMVEELLNDAEFRQKNKKKYQQIIAEKAAQASGKRNNKKKKFHHKK